MILGFRYVIIIVMAIALKSYSKEKLSGELELSLGLCLRSSAW